MMDRDKQVKTLSLALNKYSARIFDLQRVGNQREKKLQDLEAELTRLRDLLRDNNIDLGGD